MNPTYLTAKKVRERFGVTDMTIYRWLHNEDMKFPKPTYINKRRYFIISEIENWENVQRFNGAA